MKIALADNRACHVMLFSTEMIHYQLSSSDGLQELVKFLNQTFRGGTDLASCLNEVADKLNTPHGKTLMLLLFLTLLPKGYPKT